MPENDAWHLVSAGASLGDPIRRAEWNSFTIRPAAARLAEARAVQKARAAVAECVVPRLVV
jgi:hypothetical protein